MNRLHPAQELAFRFFASPLGWLLLAASPEGLCLVHFCGPQPPSRESCKTLLNKDFPSASATFSPDQPLLHEAGQEITAYFQHRQPISAFPLDLRVGTSFQGQVWKALELIPFGETRSYLEVARSIGKHRAARAVGQACGKNPIPIFIPCHRVISTNGGLGGFSSGLHLKKALLALEQPKGLAGITPRN